MKDVLALFFGVCFGAGLAIGGMTNPAKVLAFLDVFGSWDPTLAVVMGGALAVSAAANLAVKGRDRSWLGNAFDLPTRRDIDGSLVAGAALFGVGWGLVGLCPGPALADLARGSFEIALFVAAMVAGAIGYRAMTRPRPLPHRVE